MRRIKPMFAYRKQSIPSMKDADVQNKTVLLRAELNAPLDENLRVVDDYRIRETIPTIKYLLDNGAKVVICSKLGRPEGKVVPEMSMAPVAKKLQELMGVEVIMAPDVIGGEVKQLVDNTPTDKIVMLENVRFHPEEEENNSEFAKKIADLADVYVNDAFGTAHREQASVTAITKFLPSYAGLLMEKEVVALAKIADNPAQPLVAIIGGAKIEDKIDVINALAPKSEKILIGGALANTFLAAKGFSIGKSVYQEENVPVAKSLLESWGEKIVIPKDVLVAKALESAESNNVKSEKIGPDDLALDIGPDTNKIFSEHIQKAKTIIWAGPLGYCENAMFNAGTKSAAEYIKKSGAFSVIGGGDTVSAVHSLGLENNFNHISTGGGASLEFLASKPLAGLDALVKN